MMTHGRASILDEGAPPGGGHRTDGAGGCSAIRGGGGRKTPGSGLPKATLPWHVSELELFKRANAKTGERDVQRGAPCSAGKTQARDPASALRHHVAHGRA